MAKSTKAADLLKLLEQKTLSSAPSPKSSTAPAAKPGTERDRSATTKPKPSPTRTARPQGSRGKAIQFYLHDSDEKLIREFAVWLAPHRKRINDSLVIKAVLRAAKTGPGLLAAYDDGLAVTKAHQRRKKNMESV
jgi:hypothetical protein